MSKFFNDWLIRRMVAGASTPDYIEFADPAVEAICASKWGNGVGLTYEQAAAVTSIGNTFDGKASIVSFDEFKYFTSVTALPEGAFRNCASLVSLTLPTSCVTINRYAFRYDAALKRLCHDGRTVSDGEVDLPYLQSIQADSTIFQSCTSLVNIKSLGSITATTFQLFYGCTGITTIVLPSTITSVGSQLFQNCTLMRTLVCYATTPPSVETNAFRTGGASRVVTVYVPYSADHSVLEAYQAATGWAIPGAGSGLKEFIELNQDGTIPS